MALELLLGRAAQMVPAKPLDAVMAVMPTIHAVLVQAPPVHVPMGTNSDGKI